MSEATATAISEDTTAAETAPGEVETPDAATATETPEPQGSETAEAKIPEGYVKVPGENATPEEIAAFHKVLGVPDDPAGYGFDAIELPDGVEFDAERAAAIAPIMQKRGITPQAAKELAQADAAYAAQKAQEYAAVYAKEIDDGRAQLDAKWQKASLAVADMERGAVDAWKAFSDKDYNDVMKTHQMDKHPAVVAFAANAGAFAREALQTMVAEGVEPGKVQAFAKKYGFSPPEAPFVPGGSDIPASRRPGLLQYRDE